MNTIEKAIELMFNNKEYKLLIMIDKNANITLKDAIGEINYVAYDYDDDSLGDNTFVDVDVTSVEIKGTLGHDQEIIITHDINHSIAGYHLVIKKTLTDEQLSIYKV